MTTARSTLKQIEDDLNDSEKKVLWSYSGREGRTQKEALNRAKRSGKRWLRERQHKDVRKRLVKLGVLKDLTPEVSGKTPHVWKRTLEIIESDNVIAVVPSNHTTPESLRLAEFTLGRIRAAIARIDENDSWRKPRRIRTICNDEILPIIQHILDLNMQGYRLTSAHEFFRLEKTPYGRWMSRAVDLRGPLGIPASDTKISMDLDHRSHAMIVKGLGPSKMDASDTILPTTVDALSIVPESRLRMMPDNPVVIGGVRTVMAARPGSGTGLTYPSLPEWHQYLCVVAEQIEKALLQSTSNPFQGDGTKDDA